MIRMIRSRTWREQERVIAAQLGELHDRAETQRRRADTLAAGLETLLKKLAAARDGGPAAVEDLARFMSAEELQRARARLRG
ncbi:hypothetical protein OHA98_39905 [Streptomyces sp. NBC_00654]|uniref:hypothetical protein n=1 Tax=Streptomyces sp. NBC_00654 TaxID=2975799 RepID=UPI0022537A63|nr:hypothetical protein [Streptomyces sp. NBC_00654]MCX4970808.1 hypothetical protein [Streptomyces sp. NBC_00654]